MPPAFPSYIFWGGRRGCGERIDVSCWEVNYSNSWLQGAPTVMNPVCLCGVAKAKVASGSPQEKDTLGAVLPLDAEGQLPVCRLLVPQVSIPPRPTAAEAPWGQEPAVLGAGQYRCTECVSLKHPCASILLGVSLWDLLWSTCLIFVMATQNPSSRTTKLQSGPSRQLKSWANFKSQV